MKVQEIEYDSEKNLFTLQIDNKKYKISYELFEALKIKKDINLTNDELSQIANESSFEKIKDKALYYTNYTQRTDKQVRNKLSKLTNNENWIKKIMDDFYRMDLIDDYRFTQRFVEDKLKKGESKKKIENRLYMKGINEELRKNAVSKIDDETEYLNAKKALSKKFFNKDLSDFKIKQKAYNHLSYKGFDYITIERVLNDGKE